MANLSRIILTDVHYKIADTHVNFQGLDIAFERFKYGIVGPNGTGKTTLLQLIAGELVPEHGNIDRGRCSVSLLPQVISKKHEEHSLARVLGVSQQLEALQAVRQGVATQQQFELLEGAWDLEDRVKHVLEQYGLGHVDLQQTLKNLSGGQKTKVWISKLALGNSDFLLLDEPTNNLDQSSRKILYEFIEESTKSMLIVSHDRALLEFVDCILEIDGRSAKSYGGNFSFYEQQKDIEEQALQHELQNKLQTAVKTKRQAQLSLEKHQQKQSQGVQKKRAEIRGTGSYNKIEIKSKKGRSERTNRRMRRDIDRQVGDADHQVSNIREKLSHHQEIDVPLPKTHVPSGKLVLSIKDLCFGYAGEPTLLSNANFELYGPERIALVGNNGSGKSTLMKLIRSELQPITGEIKVGVSNVAYLDQTVGLLDDKKTILENFLQSNPESSLFDAHSALAGFLFRNEEAHKQVATLSGGERIRAGLAITLMGSDPPQLLLLDEPTNHLDLDSVQAIEGILQRYEGAMIVVSHDTLFLERIRVSRKINVDKL